MRLNSRTKFVFGARFWAKYENVRMPANSCVERARRNNFCIFFVCRFSSEEIDSVLMRHSHSAFEAYPIPPHPTPLSPSNRASDCVSCGFFFGHKVSCGALWKEFAVKFARKICLRGTFFRQNMKMCESSANSCVERARRNNFCIFLTCRFCFDAPFAFRICACLFGGNIFFVSSFLECVAVICAAQTPFKRMRIFFWSPYSNWAFV